MPGCSATLTGSCRSWCPTISRPASPMPASTTRWSTAHITSWRVITAPALFQRGCGVQETRPVRKRAFKGSWPVLVNQYSGPIFWGMELLSCLLPDSTSLHPVSWHLDPHLDPDQATAALSLISQQPAPECPLCHVAARRLHSRYERADLPWAGWTVRLELGVRKLFCDNPDCGRRIFTERLPGVVAPWARRTLRLGKRLTTVALGGSAGARLSRDLGIAQHAAAVDPCGAPAGLPNPDGPGRR